MKKNRWKKYLALALSISFWMQPVYGVLPEDQGVVSDPIAGTYQGLFLGETIQKNLNFKDMPDTHWAKEAAARLGAMSIVQGIPEGGRTLFKPNKKITKEEALALLVRAAGKEADAKKEAEKRQEPSADNLDFWSKGYLKIAQDFKAIESQDYQDALVEDQASLTEDNFRRTADATREEVATWMVKILNSSKLTAKYENQAIFRYSDWGEISSSALPYVETVTQAKIMQGSSGKFRPKDGISRAEMVQAIRNMEEILYEKRGLTLKNGYVGHIENATTLNNQNSVKTTAFLVRTQEGKVEKLLYVEEARTNGRKDVYSAPVYQNGRVTDLLSLKEGEKIEYLTDASGNLIYMMSKQIVPAKEFYGTLQPFTNFDKGELHLKDKDKSYYFTMVPSLYRQNPDSVSIKIQYNDRFVALKDLPYTHRVKVTVKDKLVTEIYYEGDVIRKNEISGILKEIQPDFKYLIIETWEGDKIQKKYRTSDFQVEKRAYYDRDVNSGYFDELFSHYRWDSYDGSVTDLEVGDSVHALLDESNPEYLKRISARTNYVADYGQITDLTLRGDEGMAMTVRRPDGSLTYYPVDVGVGVFTGEKRSALSDLKIGQRVKLLVNQAVIAPGNLHEKVREIVIDPLGNRFSNIYKGNVGLFNQAQNSLTLNQSYQLIHSRWDAYQPSRVLIKNDETKFYYKGQRVTADYVKKYLQQDSVTGYVVTGKDYSGEIIDTVSFFDQRESMPDRARITGLKSGKGFELENHKSEIKTDDGTIFIKENRIVSYQSILPSDYSRVILNGKDRAAVVEIMPEPGNEAVSIFRGRVAKIDEMKSFRVHSNSALKGERWIYSPIKREFELDYKTQIISEGKMIPLSEFLSYSELTKTDKVFNIVAEGTKALRILDQPFLQESVKGTVYAVDKDGIKIKDVYVYQKGSKKWVPLSLSNSYAQLTIHDSALIFRENQISEFSTIKVGETVRTMTTEDLVQSLKAGDRSAEGYLFFVER